MMKVFDINFKISFKFVDIFTQIIYYFHANKGVHNIGAKRLLLFVDAFIFTASNGMMQEINKIFYKGVK